MRAAARARSAPRAQRKVFIIRSWPRPFLEIAIAFPRLDDLRSTGRSSALRHLCNLSRSRKSARISPRRRPIRNRDFVSRSRVIHLAFRTGDDPRERAGIPETDRETLNFQAAGDLQHLVASVSSLPSNDGSPGTPRPRCAPDTPPLRLQRSQEPPPRPGTTWRADTRVLTVDRSRAASPIADGSGEEVWPDLWAANGLGVHDLIVGSSAGKAGLCQGCVCR